MSRAKTAAPGKAGAANKTGKASGKGSGRTSDSNAPRSGDINKGGRPTREEVERRRAEQEFRAGLVEQLRARKADTPYFLDLVDECIYQREQLRKLKELVAHDGIVTVGVDRGGNVRANINLLLREIRETEKSILLILKELKITTDNIISDEEDDEL
jgi:hypothetical protein